MIIYLVYIFIFSDNKQEHVTHGRKVPDILGEHKLYAIRSKCSFGVKETKYLGFILKVEEIAINPHKTSAIESWTVSESKRKYNPFRVSSITTWGLYGTVPKQLSHSHSLQETCHSSGPKVNKVHLGDLKTRNFGTVLQRFDHQYPVHVTTDASKDAIGAVLEQDLSERRHPVAFSSRTLNDAESRYSTHEIELVGLVDTLKVLRCYLHRKTSQYAQTMNHWNISRLSKDSLLNKYVGYKSCLRLTSS